MSRPGPSLATAAALCAVAASACGGGEAHPRAVRHLCRARIGFIGPSQEPLAGQQLAFARLAVASDNASQHTMISLRAARPGTRAVLAADRFAAQGVMAVVGPANDRQVRGVGPVFARAGVAFISGSATGAKLTDGANPTFFRVAPNENLEGPQAAEFVLTRIQPRGTVLLIENGAAHSRQFARAVAARFRSARIRFHSVSARGAAPAGALTAHIGPLVTLAMLAWTSPGEADRLGQALLAARKKVTLVGPSQLFDPASFTTPGSYVASPAPDITALRADASLVRRAHRAMGSFEVGAPPAYVATHVVDSAIAAVCRAGQAPSRSGVLAAIRSTDQSSSALGIPIRFRGNGDLADGRWFMFRIEPGGRYQMVARQ